jgi:hypothetical protein
MLSPLESKVYPELWPIITGFLSPQHMGRLCLCSSTMLRRIRTQLYSQVTITPQHAATLKLLLSDRDLSRKVLTFEYFYRRIPSPDSPSNDLLPDMIQQVCQAAEYMPHLQTLTLDLYKTDEALDMIGDPNKWNKFVERFNNRDIPLQSFNFLHEEPEQPRLTWPRVVAFDRLKSLECFDHVPSKSVSGLRFIRVLITSPFV